MLSKKLEKIVEFFVLISIFIIPNLGVWLCLNDVNNSLSFCTYKNPSYELSLYIIASGAGFWLLIRKRLFGIFIEKLKKNILIIIFCVYSIFSFFWSVYPIATLYQIFVMLFTTFLAVFIATYYTNNRWFSYLFWFFGIIIIASFELLLVFPHAAIMGDPNLGSWRGIFWHKNLSGSLMALGNMIFLLYAITSNKQQKGRIGICAILYILSLVYIFFSQSAAGIAIWLLLNIALVFLLVWGKFKKILSRKHYFILGGFVLFFLVIFILNINGILKVLSREPSLTGRVPLWSYLINDIASQQPVIGHGLGALWNQKSFLDQVTQSQGWEFQIPNGHNGFIDVLLDLGGVGLILVCAIFITAFYRTWKYYLASGTLESLFPFLLVLYVLLANLSISYLLEFESFHWMLLVSALFLTTLAPNKAQGSLIKQGG